MQPVVGRLERGRSATPGGGRLADRLDTAHRLLLERGYAGLAMADLAEQAGVSVPLLYKVFGPKPQLAKRVYDVLLTGDVDPVPVAQRPAIQALAADPDPRGKLARYAAISRAMMERAGPWSASS